MGLRQFGALLHERRSHDQQIPQFVDRCRDRRRLSDRWKGLTKRREKTGIDPVGLGQLPGRPSKVTRLPWIENHHLKPAIAYDWAAARCI